MKKITLIFGILMSIILIYNNQEEYILIPNEAIRVRVIANSNKQEDIDVKEKVKNEIKEELKKLLNNSKTIDETRIIIKNNLSNINSIVQKTLSELNYNDSFNINYGLNYFPEKEFKGVMYKEGYYESLVITLGEGSGTNFWCVLYPPLCDLEYENKKDIEYKIFVKEIIDKYL